ncbi:MAG: maleylpyruvate isomerase N-terminal domain-containing protein, partial [Chloroflexi bacterium]|nr:maleylpyruvate isomerase N-terminal domain-containing protein [Chloroflexota bacterium]
AEGWSYRDVLAHLAASEDYNRACLDGAVAEFIAKLGEAGATDFDSANALGIEQLAHLQPNELLVLWRNDNADVRPRFRERGDGTVDSSVGEYPARWQAWHLASEIATHADDVHLPITDAERDHRRDWRARFSRFAIAEVKPDASITVVDRRTKVTGPDGVAVEVDDDTLIEGAMARLGDDSELTDEQRALLRAI